jgi:hypothetical protein
MAATFSLALAKVSETDLNRVAYSAKPIHRAPEDRALAAAFAGLDRDWQRRLSRRLARRRGHSVHDEGSRRPTPCVDELSRRGVGRFRAGERRALPGRGASGRGGRRLDPAPEFRREVDATAGDLGPPALPPLLRSATSRGRVPGDGSTSLLLDDPRALRRPRSGAPRSWNSPDGARATSAAVAYLRGRPRLPVLLPRTRLLARRERRATLSGHPPEQVGNAQVLRQHTRR